MNKQTMITVTLCGLVLAGLSGQAQPRGAGGRGAVKNTNGGTTAGAVYGGSGAKGKYGRVAGVTTDSEGNAVGGSAGGFQGANGSQGIRTGRTAVNADGSATHSGQAHASGTQGNISSQGSATRSTDGTLNGSRSTNAATSQGSYQGQTTYASGSGAVHTSACKDASGNEVPCPTRNSNTKKK